MLGQEVVGQSFVNTRCRLQWLGRNVLLSLMVLLLAPGQTLRAAEEPLTGKSILKRCASKYPGDDQRSRFTVMLRDAKGGIKKSEYLRIWKDFKGRDGVADKMILFTIFPPEAKGSSFMRVAYVPAVNKSVDQWIYLPVLKKIRRVSIRNPADSFLNSNLTYADVGERALEMDTHKYLGVRDIKGKAYYVVESVPKEDNPQYSKREFWFDKGESADWSECVNVRIDYYDQGNELLKVQFIKWQEVGGAWVWDRVLVRNVRNKTASVFQISGVSINTDLKDELFSERTLVKGPGVIPKLPVVKKRDAPAAAKAAE